MRPAHLAAAALLFVALTSPQLRAEETAVQAPLAAVRVMPAYAEAAPRGIVGIRSRTQRNLERLGRVLNYYMAQKYSEGR